MSSDTEKTITLDTVSNGVKVQKYNLAPAILALTGIALVSLTAGSVVVIRRRTALTMASKTTSTNIATGDA